MMQLIDHASFMAHGYCLLWHPWLVALFAGSDLLIFIAYSVIPIALFQFLRRRPGLGYRHLVGLFAAFIMLCGLTHLIAVFTLWIPIYPLLGVVKLLTAIVSLVTAAVLFPLVPKLAALPSPHDLQEANDRLQQEVSAHKETLAQLREAQQALEEKVAERTAALEVANQRLSVVMRETAHRSRNILTVVQSLARQTARTAPNQESFLERFWGRLSALADATRAVVEGGKSGAADIETIVRSQLDPYLSAYPDRIGLAGPPCPLPADAAQQVALAVHELATNAVKHGSLSHQEGRADLSWTLRRDGDTPTLEIEWRESGTSPDTPLSAWHDTEGFGNFLLIRAVPMHLGAAVHHELTAHGLSYRLSVPLDRLEPEADSFSPGRAEMAFPLIVKAD